MPAPTVQLIATKRDSALIIDIAEDAGSISTQDEATSIIRTALEAQGWRVAQWQLETTRTKQDA